MAKIDELFRYLKEKGGSDLHLLATLPPRVRIHGKLTDVEGWGVISDEELKKLLQEICSEEQWLEFEACGDLDFAWTLPGEARFRVNFLNQYNGVGAVFRIIPEKILTFDDNRGIFPIKIQRIGKGEFQSLHRLEFSLGIPGVFLSTQVPGGNDQNCKKQIPQCRVVQRQSSRDALLIAYQMGRHRSTAVFSIRNPITPSLASRRAVHCSSAGHNAPATRRPFRPWLLTADGPL